MDTPLKPDADFVREETEHWTREELVNEIIRLRQVWRIDVRRLVNERNELKEQIREFENDRK